MKKLSEFSVNYPVTVLMLILAVGLLGIISFQRLGIDLFPDLNNPRLFVQLSAGERPPEEIEQQFVKSVESLAMRQKNVIQVSSVSRVGSAQITVEYSWKADMDEAFLDLQKTLTGFAQNDEIDEITISQHDPNAAPIMLIGFSHPEIGDMAELRQVAQNYIRNELVRLPSIAEVELLGGEEKEVVVRTDSYLLQSFALTPEIVANRIKSYNRNVSGGSIVEMGRKYIIKGISEFQSTDDIGNVILAYRRQTSAAGAQEAQTRVPVYLKDVARIELANKEPQNIVRINGQRCMALAVYKETKFNTVRAVDELMTALEDLQKALPGYEFTVVQNQGQMISQAIDEVEQAALVGIFFAVLVLYLFLRRFSTTAIIAIAIPISIVATFNLMYFNGLTLNVMTLGGLALGAGMLVDNAIVVMENIFRNFETGKSLRASAIEGTAQVGGAITASTITTIVVFLPIVYLHGAAGELFKDQAWTVAFSLISSLVVAILVIPMLATRFIRRDTAAQSRRSIRFSWYKPVLAGVLNRKIMVIVGALLLIVISVLLIPVVGSEFMPATKVNEFSVDLRLPPGTDLRRTERTVVDIEDIIHQIAGRDIETVYSKIGPSPSLTGTETSGMEDENTAEIKIVMKRKHEIAAETLMAALSAALEPIPDLEAQFVREETALQNIVGTENADIVVEVIGDDLDELQFLTDQVKERLQKMTDLFNIRTSFEKGRPEVQVVVDRTRAGLANVSVDQISTQLQDLLVGRVAGQWDYEGDLEDITLRLPDIAVQQLDDILIDTGSEKIRLDDVADIRFVRAPGEIYRRNQNRIGKVSAHIQSRKPFDHVVREIEKELASVSFSADYRYEITGEEQQRKEAFQNLKFALILSIILVYMVLASQFESLIHPLTILLTIPLAGVGAVFTFFLLGMSFNIMAYIGLIMLVGIAVNDSIILVDAINQLKRQGLSVREAIAEAGQRRIRPIIMTSLTTVLALLPLTFGFGEGAALSAPMALAVIGGLVTSTILTLVVIPCVYLQFENMIAWFRRYL